MNIISRKAMLSALVVALMLIVFDGTGVSLAFSATGGALANTSPSSNKVELPAGSVNPAKIFFPDYAQFVANPLLHYWRANGRFDTFGGPMSHTDIDKEGNSVQYFQKMALAYYPSLANTAWEVRPYHAGRLFVESLSDDLKNAFPYGRIGVTPTTATSKYFPETGHTLQAGFYELYNKTGGLFIYGFPISQEYERLDLTDGKTYRYQLFERGRMRWSADTGATVDPNFGTEMAAFNHANVSVEMNPEPLPGQEKIPNYNSWDWEHWVDVNLSIQSETFYEGDLPIRSSLVTTGLPGHDTPTGDFYIWSRVYNEHMKGGSIGAGDYYDLYNVLYTMYFTYEGHALHDAWWRSVFGVTGSHGCVNQDLETSAFAWDYLTIGSRVHIHY